MRRTKDSDVGSALVESVVIFPLMIFLIVAIIDLSNSLFHHEVLTQVTREVARSASAVPRLELGIVRAVDNGGGAYTCQFDSGSGWGVCDPLSKYSRLIDRAWLTFRDWEQRENLRVRPNTRSILIENFSVFEPGSPTPGRRVRVRVGIIYDAFFSYNFLYGVLGDRPVGAEITNPKL